MVGGPIDCIKIPSSLKLFQPKDLKRNSPLAAFPGIFSWCLGGLESSDPPGSEQWHPGWVWKHVKKHSNSWHDITPYQMMCRVLYINIIMPIDVRIRLLITWWKEVHWRYTLNTSTCPSAAPQIPFCCWKCLFIPNIKEAQFFTQKNIFHLPELSPCTTSNSNPSGPPTPIVACYQVVIRSPTISQSFEWIFLVLLGSTGEKWRTIFWGWLRLIFFQKKQEKDICLSNLWFIQVLQRKQNHLNEPSDPPFFFGGNHLNWFPGCKGCSFFFGAPKKTPEPRKKTLLLSIILVG